MRKNYILYTGNKKRALILEKIEFIAKPTKWDKKGH